MSQTRREVLQGLLGLSSVGLSAAATGLPVSLLLFPHTAVATNPAQSSRSRFGAQSVDVRRSAQRQRPRLFRRARHRSSRRSTLFCRADFDRGSAPPTAGLETAAAKLLDRTVFSITRRTKQPSQPA